MKRRRFPNSIQVYFTLLASAPNVSMRTSDQIFRNVEDILSLHEELLLHIRIAVLDSELKSDPPRLPCKRQSKHIIISSSEDPWAIPSRKPVDTVRRSTELSWLGRPKRGILVSGPREVAEVAKIFGRLVREPFGIVFLSFANRNRWFDSLCTRNMGPNTN